MNIARIIIIFIMINQWRSRFSKTKNGELGRPHSRRSREAPETIIVVVLSEGEAWTKVHSFVEVVLRQKKRFEEERTPQGASRIKASPRT